MGKRQSILLYLEIYNNWTELDVIGLMLSLEDKNLQRNEMNKSNLPLKWSWASILRVINQVPAVFIKLCPPNIIHQYRDQYDFWNTFKDHLTSVQSTTVLCRQLIMRMWKITFPLIVLTGRYVADEIKFQMLFQSFIPV